MFGKPRNYRLQAHGHIIFESEEGHMNEHAQVQLALSIFMKSKRAGKEYQPQWVDLSSNNNNEREREGERDRQRDREKKDKKRKEILES